MKLAVVIITYDKVDHAKLSFEVIRKIWASEKLLSKIDIYHVFNGKKEWYPKKTKEDVLIKTNNLGHYEGAANMMDLGMKAVLNSKEKYDYVVAMSADVFLIKSNYLVTILQKMKNRNMMMATSLWLSYIIIPKLFATEFFIIDTNYINKVFPLNLKKYFHNRKIVSLLDWIDNYIFTMIEMPKVELVFTEKILKICKSSFFSFKWKKHILLLPGRKTVLLTNRYSSKKIGYFSCDDLGKKKKLFEKYLDFGYI